MSTKRWSGRDLAYTAPDGSGNLSEQGHRFMHNVRNTRANLLDKERELSLREAVDEDRAPRHRRNHRQPHIRDDDGKRWDRMVRHSDGTPQRCSGLGAVGRTVAQVSVSR